MMLKKISILIFLLIASSVQAQNLVPNYSFETFSEWHPEWCECGSLSNPWNAPYSPNFLTPPWYTPTSGSPDCFKPCSPDPDYSVPKNWAGFQYPRTGIGYAYITCRVFSNSYQNAREYLQVKLLEPLVAGNQYNVEFFISLDSANYAIDRIGMYLSDTIIWLPLYDFHVLSFTPQIANPEYNYITNTTGWERISGIYTAQGGERYITIGNFYDDNNTHQVLIDTTLSGIPGCGFYIDDVSVTLIEEPKTENVLYIPNIFSPNNDGQNDKLFVRGQQIESLHFIIYNRWGNLVYESNDINHGWDGTQNGKKSETGVYVYRAEVTFKDGETLVKRGNVTLVR